MKLITNKLKPALNKSIILLVVLSILSCRSEPNKCVDLKASQAELEANLRMYETVWDKVINGRQIDLINSSSFDEGVTAVATSEGDIVGLENFKNYYNNYIVGFSDAQFTIIDAFGQGDKIVKHWNFRGTHDGEFFGVPATGKKVDVSGVTLVKMKNGRISAEQDFMDLLDFYTQLGLM
tara:strand:- start:37 stop:573 length:537 start_codon:yes stop_codon:yes gene_type:complete